MIKEKISPEILNNVTILSESTSNVCVLSTNFFETKKFLDNNSFKYKSYFFAKCFFVCCNNDDISILSSQNHVSYLAKKSEIFSLKQTDILSLHNLTLDKYFGQGQTICFIDTGIAPKFDFILPNNRITKFVDMVDGNTKIYDDNGHGTFVSGIACGNGIFNKSFSGIAPLAKIISIKALSKDGNSDSNKILDAMQWIYENHKVYNISAVCMSFGADTIDKIEPLTQGADALWKRGIIVVAAAGNSGPNPNTIKSPGNNPNIITVGALDPTTLNVANFSSRGPTIYGNKPDLIAPAVNIISCDYKNIYTNMSGTSVAAPIVAGICAIIKSRWPDMTNRQVKEFLMSNCTPITNNPNIEGAGYLNFSNLKKE